MDKLDLRGEGKERKSSVFSHVGSWRNTSFLPQTQGFSYQLHSSGVALCFLHELQRNASWHWAEKVKVRSKVKASLITLSKSACEILQIMTMFLQCLSLCVLSWSSSGNGFLADSTWPWAWKDAWECHSQLFNCGAHCQMQGAAVWMGGLNLL